MDYEYPTAKKYAVTKIALAGQAGLMNGAYKQTKCGKNTKNAPKGVLACRKIRYSRLSGPL